ncbi:methyl-accepting chemotaxis protein [Chitinivorax tropicus]|uniref:Methyl-accepting chemotaxis protein n=1 Tax=Chitinivorax tropicus TaxID=714531 RepID=A0A840MN64_9PROT|nr:methyl-accepting chemotaxis protein [Chitinivorax tropicus]MBB5017946.1 methyl-accepting chemotaxis protein [Chitinivorax tropicus]
MRHLSIAQKLFFGFAGILAVVAVLVLITLTNLQLMNKAIDRNEHTLEVIASVEQMQLGLLDAESAVRGFALTGLNTVKEPVDKGMATVQQHADKLKQLLAEQPEQLSRLDAMNGLIKQWQSESVKPFIELREKVTTGAAAMDELVSNISTGNSKPQMDAIRAKLAEIADAERRILEENKAAADRVSGRTTSMLAIGSVVALLLGLAIGITLSRGIAKRLGHAARIARQTADGNLVADIRADRDDEIGQVFQAMHDMQQGLRTIISQIQQTGRQLTDASRDIAGASHDLAHATHDQSGAASAMAASMEELTVSINYVSDNSLQARDISTQSGQLCTDGDVVIKRTVEGIQQLAGTVRETAAAVNELGSHAQQISSIIGVIKEIADQTNLLALNASIEAARAGEQGRGFAVVADEVRKLAERTSQSTQEITTTIEKIQSGMRVAVAAMDTSMGRVDEGVQLANQAGAAMQQIQSGSNRVLTVVQDISNALQEQGAASGDVARSVERIALMTESNNGSVRQTADAAKQLEALAMDLEGAVSRFRLR